MDDLTPEQRRKNMQAIRSTDTSIEIALRTALWHRGVRYRKNYKQLPGKPDIAITKYRIVVFCDSDYWHGYDWENRHQRIKSNRDYWIWLGIKRLRPSSKQWDGLYFVSGNGRLKNA